ncbi:MAG: glycosyl hydrolase family 8 [Paludibacteraceae bacterium]|nr:glycosyl hydrolase family 8 [Paludibacteraceae bacterium]
MCCIFCSIGGAFAQNVAYDPSQFIEVNINSGNPTFPYPQFKEYKGGKSLAKNNAEGVTHADMEKAGREAYEIMTHRCRYFGGTHCGVKYIVFNPISNGGTTETSLTYPDVPGAYGTFCSEGDGYILLAAALFADQKTYNGLYMWIHDNRFSGVKRFKDGKMFRENKKGFTTCPYLAGWGADETTTTEGKCHSATDGDVDIAMATLIAYKQWGEFMRQDGEIVKDANGDPISYLYEAQRCIGALVDTVPQWEYGANTLAGYLPGVIGIDGYTKDGVAQGEVTRWRFSDAALARYGNINGPYNGGPVLMSQYGKMFADYDAPSYYDEFYKWFKEDGAKDYDKDITAWRVHQFQKAAASGNWITKKAYEAGKYAAIGNFSVGDDGSNPTFGESGLDGEDFRFAWRHLLDYLWHGETAYDWDPKDHSVIEGQSHDGVKLMGIRHAELMKNPPGVGDKPGTEACAKLGASPDAGQPMWSGVVHNPQQYNSDGTIKSFYHTNYSIGAGSPAAVIAEDQDFLNDLYRSLELRWDGNNTDVGAEDEERYLGSTPKYFHGWYRTLGMLVCQGNMHAPADMKPAANMKVYMSVDKTYAYVDDEIDYTVQYRNYGTLDAKGVQITTEIDPNYEVVSISNGGKFANGKIVWNIGSVPGFKSGHLDETIDSVSFKVVARDTLNPRICLTSTISGSNFEDWVSNEFPNHATYTMERNCVDILAARTLTINKKASRKAMNPGDVVAFTVEFENKSLGKSSWLNGGRDNVRLSYGNYMMSNTANLFYQYYRFWNDAYEPYINLGNYRVSYFMYDAASIGLYDEGDNPTGWQFELDNGGDMAKYGWMPTGAETKFTYQKMPNGEDEHGKWNQRIMIQFPSSLMAASAYVYDHLNNAFQLHKGGYGPCFFRTRLGIKQAKAMYEKVKDDWSYSGDLAISALDGQAETFTLISPGWANYDNPGYEITNYARNICNPTSVGNYNRVLVEEFDGYTWRRIQGEGPLPGREAINVVVVDTIPYELEWVGWKDSTALKDDKGEKIKATYTPAANPKSAGYTGIVKWTSPTMLVGEKDKLIYLCKARDLGCPDVEDTYYTNTAWISSQTDSESPSSVELMTSCAELPPVIDEQTCLYKTANVSKAMSGDDVSYEIKFINNVGTKVDANCKDKKEWVVLNNKSYPDVNNGLVLSKESIAFCAPKYAYGKDGEVYATIENASNTESIFLVFRYVSGTPGQPDFKGVAIKMKINLSGANNFGYELYNDGKLVAAEGTDWKDIMQYKGSSTAPTFKFVLRGEKLYMYCNDEDDEWENVMKDWSGLTSAGPGYFGVYTGRNNGSPTLTKYLAEVDYAFNVTVGDYIPAELEEITDITPSGEYNESTGTLKWPTVALDVKDGIAPGDSLIYNFDARVKDCKNFINNYAFATVYGLDSLKALNTIECGEEDEDCPLESAVAKLSAETICAGDSAVIKVVPTPASKDYVYSFYKDKELINKKPISADSLVVKESGSYYAIVSDPTCKSTSEALTKTVKLEVNDLPAVVLSEDTTICQGNDLSLAKQGASGYDINWYIDETASFPLEDLEVKAEDVAKNYYYTFTDKKTGCVGEIEKFAVKIEATPKPPFAENGEYPLTAGAKQDITDLATIVDGGHIVWYESETAKDSLNAPIKISLDKEAEFDYFVSAVSDGGCESERVLVHVAVTNSTKPKTRDTVICIGESVDVLSLVSKEEGYTLNWVNEDGTPAEEPSVYKAEGPGEKKYYVTQTDGVSVSDVAEISIKSYGVGSVLAKDVELCAKTEAEALKVYRDPASLSEFVKIDGELNYKWYLAGVELDADALTPNTNVSQQTEQVYKIVPTYTISKDNVCYGDTAELKVTINHISSPEVKHSINYTLQDGEEKGKFESLTVFDPTAVTPDEDMELVWYDKEGNLIGEEAPVPEYDANLQDDVQYTYYVAQKNENGCESEKSKVIVNVSKTPLPEITEANFCQDEVTDKLLSDFVKVTDDTYHLVWYDGDPKNGGNEIPMQQISTRLTEDAVEQIIPYYVAQSDGTKTSGAIALEVHIFAKPELITFDTTVCNKAVNLNSLWKVSNKVSTVYTDFFNADDDKVAAPEAIGETGKYTVEGYFEVPVSKSRCVSERKDINVKIFKLDDIEISGPNSICPDSPVELLAIVSGENDGTPYKYEWSQTNKASVPEDGVFVSENLKETTSIQVEVTDGYCRKKSEQFTVTIGAGQVSGTFTYLADQKDPEVERTNGKPLTFSTCGGEFVLDASKLDKTENAFKWLDENNREVSSNENFLLRTDKPGTYTAVFVNECETSLQITVTDASINDNTIIGDKDLCEGYSASLVLDFSSATKTSLEWKKDDVVLDETSKTLSIKSASAVDHSGVYSYTISNGDCKVENVYGTINVIPAPEFELIPVDMVCAGSSVKIGLSKLEPAASTTVKWYDDETLQPSGIEALATPLTDKTYNFEIQQGAGCSIKQSVKVSVQDPIDFIMTPEDTVACYGASEIRLRLRVLSGDVDSYSWVDPSNVEVSNTSTYKAPTNKIGTSIYTVTLSNEACGDVTHNVSVEVVGVPAIDTFTKSNPKDIELIPNPDLGSGSYEYSMDGKDYQSSALFTSLSYGKHTATIRDEYGCKSDFAFELPSPTVVIPTVVTPDGDGENDLFKSEVLSEAYPNAKVTIYDRTGKVIAKMPASEGWDGTYNGHRLPSTDYWYEIWIDEIRKMYVGHFTLINN